MSIKRYRLGSTYYSDIDVMLEDEHGEYVRHDDYAALEAECAWLREKIGRLTSDPIEPIEGGPT